MSAVIRGKTVYVLGAGFSKAAGFPLQSEILPRIREFRPENIDIISTPNFAPFEENDELLFPFLNTIFERSQPTLEDIFTLLDQAIARREYCQNYSWEKLEEVRRVLKTAVLFVLHDASEKIDEQQEYFYQSIAAHFIDERIKAPLDDEPLSFLLLNWDSLLEDQIYKCLRRTNGIGKADIDYCCKTLPLATSPHTGSPIQKAKGIYNIKIIKLHGSSNWLRCPNCNKLFTGIGGEIGVWEQYAVPQPCPDCSSGTRTFDEDSEPRLEPFMITPTYVKLFDNTHIQAIWDEAYLTLAEADKVIFIGYSLPEADYHFRTLLKRALRRDVEVSFVGRATSQAAANTAKRLRQYFPVTRYTNFFGPSIEFDLTGSEGYFGGVLGERTLVNRMRSLKRRFRGL